MSFYRRLMMTVSVHLSTVVAAATTYGLTLKAVRKHPMLGLKNLRVFRSVFMREIVRSCLTAAVKFTFRHSTFDLVK